MNLDLNLSLDKGPPKITPKTTKILSSCKLEYADGTVIELPVENDQGFHRISEHNRKGQQVTIHEVFITYGTS